MPSTFYLPPCAARHAKSVYAVDPPRAPATAAEVEGARPVRSHPTPRFADALRPGVREGDDPARVRHAGPSVARRSAASRSAPGTPGSRSPVDATLRRGVPRVAGQHRPRRRRAQTPLFARCPPPHARPTSTRTPSITTTSSGSSGAACAYHSWSSRRPPCSAGRRTWSAVERGQPHVGSRPWTAAAETRDSPPDRSGGSPSTARTQEAVPGVRVVPVHIGVGAADRRSASRTTMPRSRLS